VSIFFRSYPMEAPGLALLLKLVIVGDSGVGKTNLVARYVVDEFNIESPSTIGVDFMTKTLTMDGLEVRAQLWDTAGQEKFRAIARTMYQGAKGAAVVYDITNRSSFEAVPHWVEEFQHHVPPTAVILLIGNKCDLEDQRQVPTETARAFAQDHGYLFLETSALDTTNVDKAFVTIIGEIVSRIQHGGPPHSDGRKPSLPTAPNPDIVRIIPVTPPGPPKAAPACSCKG